LNEENFKSKFEELDHSANSTPSKINANTQNGVEHPNLDVLFLYVMQKDL
jgi:hypothetical protein